MINTWTTSDCLRFWVEFSYPSSVSVNLKLTLGSTHVTEDRLPLRKVTHSLVGSVCKGARGLSKNEDGVEVKFFSFPPVERRYLSFRWVEMSVETPHHCGIDRRMERTRNSRTATSEDRVPEWSPADGCFFGRR